MTKRQGRSRRKPPGKRRSPSPVAALPLRVALLILLPFLVLFAIYYPSLGVPFYLDDFSSIVQNRAVTGGSLLDVLRAEPMRALTYATFWLTHRWSGTDPSPYHAFSVALHAANTCVLMLFAWWLRLGRSLTPATGPGPDQGAPAGPLWQALLPAAAAATVFALHPLQSQAVVYVAQRAALLSAFFYVVSLCLYGVARCGRDPRSRCAAWLVLPLTVFGACVSKQNAFSLPLMLLLFEFWIVHARQDAQPLDALSYLRKITQRPWVPVTVAVLSLGALWMGWESLDRLTRESEVVSRWDYATTQPFVLALYQVKWFLPVNLHLEYDLDAGSVSSAMKALCVLWHVAVLVACVRFRRRYPPLCFGIVFYYVAHSVESSLIPIKDFAVEHRNYLPHAGLAIACGDVLARALRRFSEGRVAIVFAVILLVLAALTVQRIAQWRDPVAFYENEYRHSPDHPRVVANLARRYLESGNRAAAFALLEKSYAAEQGDLSPYLANPYLLLFIETRPAAEVYAYARQVLPQVRRPEVRLQLLVNTGVYAFRRGDFALAERYLAPAIALPGAPGPTWRMLATALEEQGRAAAAAKVLEAMPASAR